MSQLSLSLMNRLNKTESAVFKVLDAVYPKDLFSDYFDKSLNYLRTLYDNLQNNLKKRL